MDIAFFILQTHNIPKKNIVQPHHSINMKCPKCLATVSTENINIQADIAKCTHCGAIFKVSENLTDDTYETFDINTPPSGVSFRRDVDTTIISATTRSAIAFILVPFMLVWSSGSLGGIYGSQISQGKFDIFMSLFGIPFIVGSVLFWSAALMAIFGKVVLTLDRQGGKIFTGIGNIGITQRFIWSEVSNISQQTNYSRSLRNADSVIAIEGKKRITFGSGLSDDRRYYILHALKKIYRQVKR